MKIKLASSLALVVKINKVSMYAFDETCTNLLHFWKRNIKKIQDFLRDMCRTAFDAKALWKRRPTKPISSKVPYYLFFLLFFFLLVVMSIALLVETQGLLQQLWLYGVRPIRKSGPPTMTVLPITMQKKKKQKKNKKKTSRLIHSQSQGCLEGNLFVIAKFKNSWSDHLDIKGLFTSICYWQV